MKLSLIIPCKDKNDPKLQELLKSIEIQDFPKDEMETLIITEGTSESAKAIGIRRAKTKPELMGTVEIRELNRALLEQIYPEERFC